MLDNINNRKDTNKRKYYKPIDDCIQEIKKLLSMHESYSGEEIIDKINKKSDEIISHFLHIKEVYRHDTKTLLPMVLDFFQNLYSNFEVTYFYNRFPNISYKKFGKLNTGQQILNNVFDGKVYIKKDCLIKEDYIKGGNCHHRSLIIKKIFDKIDLPGVECKINFEGHSFISIEFGSKTRIIDMIPQTKGLLENHIYVLNEKAIQKYGTSGHYQLLDTENSYISRYTDIEKYKNNVLKNLKHNTIRLGINNIKLEISRSQIIYRYKDTGKKEKEIIQSIKLKKPLSEYTKTTLLQEIFGGIKVFPQELIPLISKKIREKHLFSIFK